ncbi:MAG: metallophosphoesterase family protein [bacterium]
MKYLIFSDVHGNLEALEALLTEVAREQPDRIFFLGDAVGYGANPSECLHQIAETADLMLAGNHDYAAAGLTSPEFFNPLAREAIFWTQSQLTPEEKLYLGSLPVILQFPQMCLVHSTPRKPAEWHYIFSEDDAAENFPCFSSALCFIGHSHQVQIITTDGFGNYWRSSGESIVLEEGHRSIINVGSAGQPRDYDPRGAYCIYEEDEHKKQIQIRRFEYDIPKAQHKIIQAGLPYPLAERLSFGA